MYAKVYTVPKPKPVKYPCGVCSHGCGTNSIECSGCLNWIHRRCIPTKNVDILEKWFINKELNFLCNACAFADGCFDAKASLERLFDSLDTDKFDSSVMSEQLMLDTYNVEVKKNDNSANMLAIGQSVDRISEALLQKFHPVVLNDVYPVSVLADGNCLYRAISKAICGDENQHEMIRLLSALEIAQNPKHYDSACTDYVDLIKCEDLVLDTYVNILRTACKAKGWSDTSHMYAVSSALGIVFNSYCPPVLNDYFMSRPLSRRVCGRNVKLGSPQFSIMWSRTSVPAKQGDFIPNHFVLLKPHVSPDTSLIEITNNSGPFHSTPISTNKHSFHMDASRIPESVNCSVGKFTIDTNSTPNEQSENEPKQESRDQSSVAEEKDTTVQQLDISLDGTSVNAAVDQCDKHSPQKSNISSDNVLIDQNIDTHGNSSIYTELAAEGGRDLPGGKPLSIGSIIQLLSSGDNVLGGVPNGLKENVYFIINNTSNVERKKSGKMSQFWDDCGAWCSDSASPKTLFIRSENGDMIKVYKKGDIYCLQRRQNKQYIYIPVEPQPDSSSIFEVQRNYARSKINSNYQRRITWSNNTGFSQNCCFEYLGTFPGRKAHGLSVKNTNTYVRTKPEVVKKIKERVKNNAPNKVYKSLVDVSDVFSAPKSLKQVQDIKYQEKKKTKGNDQKLKAIPYKLSR